MRQEVARETGGTGKAGNVTIIVVEPGDERVHILASLTQLAGQRIIVALPDDAVFRRPGDLRELKQAASQAHVELTLVIASNERLRLWARAQGFTVFSSLETCARAQSSTFPKNSGQFKVPGVPITRQTSRITEPLYVRPVAPPVPNLTRDLSQSGISYAATYGHVQDVQDRVQAHTQAVDIQFADVQLTDTPVDIQLIDVQKALDKQIAEEKAQDRLAQPFSLLSNAPALPTEPEAVDLLPTRERAIWHDRLLFILVALLALGIMGGLSFGYLLSLAHTATLLPASLALVDQVVH